MSFTPLAPAFLAQDPALTAEQDDSDIVALGGGRAAVIYEDSSSGAFPEVVLRIVTTEGRTAGTTAVDGRGTGSFNPYVTALTDGRIVVSWVAEANSGAGDWSVWARVFNSDGTSQGNGRAIVSAESLPNGAGFREMGQNNIEAKEGGGLLQEHRAFTRDNGYEAYNVKHFGVDGSGSISPNGLDFTVPQVGEGRALAEAAELPNGDIAIVSVAGNGEPALLRVLDASTGAVRLQPMEILTTLTTFNVWDVAVLEDGGSIVIGGASNDDFPAFAAKYDSQGNELFLISGTDFYALSDVPDFPGLEAIRADLVPDNITASSYTIEAMPDGGFVMAHVMSAFSDTGVQTRFVILTRFTADGMLWGEPAVAPGSVQQGTQSFDPLLSADEDGRLFVTWEYEDVIGSTDDDSYVQVFAPVIFGTDASESLSPLNGAREIAGFGGDDTISGSVENDLVFAGAGEDVVFTGIGNDEIHGGPGADLLYGVAGNDSIYGDAGADVLGGSTGDDLLVGGEGDDQLWGAAGNDSLFGEGGNDTLGGAAGNDLLSGGAGNDEVFAS